MIKIFIKCCQRQQVSTLLLKTLLGVVHWVVCLKIDLFWFWLVPFVYSNKKCPGFTDWIIWRALKRTKWIKKKAVSWFVGFECPFRGEKKLLLEQENLDTVLNSISTWTPACILNLKVWILKMRASQVNIFKILKSCISKWENRLEWADFPQRNITPSHRATLPPWKQKKLTSP